MGLYDLLQSFLQEENDLNSASLPVSSWPAWDSSLPLTFTSDSSYGDRTLPVKFNQNQSTSRNNSGNLLASTFSKIPNRLLSLLLSVKWVSAWSWAYSLLVENSSQLDWETEHRHFLQTPSAVTKQEFLKMLLPVGRDCQAEQTTWKSQFQEDEEQPWPFSHRKTN